LMSVSTFTRPCSPSSRAEDGYDAAIVHIGTGLMSAIGDNGSESVSVGDAFAAPPPGPRGPLAPPGAPFAPVGSLAEGPPEATWFGDPTELGEGLGAGSAAGNAAWAACACGTSACGTGAFGRGADGGVAGAAAVTAFGVPFRSTLPLAPPLPVICASTNRTLGASDTTWLFRMSRAKKRKRSACAASAIASALMNLPFVSILHSCLQVHAHPDAFPTRGTRTSSARTSPAGRPPRGVP
jgi:hypothetical protein